MRLLDIEVSVNCNEKKVLVGSLISGKTEEKDNIKVSFEEIAEGKCNIGRIKVDILRRETWDTNGLNIDEPIVAEAYFDELPEKMTCMYLYGPWWTRPAFVQSFEDIPDKTQVLFCKNKNDFTCILPMVGDDYKTVINGSGSKDRIRFVMDAGIAGVRHVDETMYISSTAETLSLAIENITKTLEKKYDIKPREKRKYPEMFKYVGWCSWDAFYKDISEEKVLDKAKEIAEKKLPIRWMIFDDGWLQDENDMLNDIAPDEKKFPGGFDQLITKVKSETPVNWVGVWHAFGGYWAGINPKSRLAKEKAQCLYKTVNGRIVPSPYNGRDFYGSWYKELKAGQVDFVKVDGQSSMPVYFRNDMSYVKGARLLSNELEDAAGIFDKNVINCMGMAMENILSRNETGISRNSDDFVPNKEKGFEEHILQNAYNSLYHNEIYYCDWDMFWTEHKDALKHSLLRAISGGPVYVSDEIGKSDGAVIKKLCLHDGKILMLDRSAKPCEDVVFEDVTKRGLLKINNAGQICNGNIVGIIAVFNFVDSRQTGEISIGDIPELKDVESCYVYDYKADTVVELNKDDTISVSLNREEYGYYIFFPKDECVLLGLIEKYVGFKALLSSEVSENGIYRFKLREKGKIGFVCRSTVEKVSLNGEDITNRLIDRGSYYLVDINGSPEECMLEVAIKRRMEK